MTLGGRAQNEADARRDNKPVQPLEALIEEELDRFQVPGIAAAVVKDGEVVLSRGFGLRDKDKELPVTEQTLFPIGSTTKAFTAAVIGTFVDEGLLEWDRPVREYLPSFKLHDPVASNEATLLDLLSHRTGLPRHEKLMLMYGSGGLTRAEVVERLRYLPFNKGFREVWQYNNLLYMTAGYLIEVVAGQTWEEAVQERLLDPLGMTDTNLWVNELQKSDDHSVPYALLDGEVAEVPYRPIELIGPAGSINSCVADMARWLRFNAEGGRETDILSASTLKTIHSPVIPMPTDSAWEEVSLVGYGLGWMVEHYRGHRVIWHSGGIDGFIAWISFIPDRRAGVVVLSNRFPSLAAYAIPRRIYDELLGFDPIPWGERYLQLEEATATGTEEMRAHRRSKAKDAPPTHPLDEFAGTYTHPGYGRISFAVEDGDLVADLHDLRVTMSHRHFNVWDAYEPSLDLSLPFSFAVDLDGEIARVEARLEPTLDPIVFEKEPDRSLTDPEFLQRLAGTYELAPWKLDIEVVGEKLKMTSPVLGNFDLVPRLGLRFVGKGELDVRFEFVLTDDGSALEVVVEPYGVFGRVKETA